MLSWLVSGPAVHSGFEGAPVHARKGAGDLVGEKRIVAGCNEEFGNAPNVFFGGHPMLLVKTGEIHGV